MNKTCWEEKKLDHLKEKIYSGGTPSTTNPNYWNGSLLWLSSGEVKNRFITNTDKKITELGVKESSTKLTEKNDVLIACAGQGKTRGEVAFCLVNTFINQSIIAIRTKKDLLSPLFLFYNLNNRYDELRSISDSSSSRGSITCPVLGGMSIKYPKDLKQQQKIETFLYNYDNLIKNNKKRIKILEQTAKIIYEEWFVNFKFPGHENVKRVDSGTEFGKIPEEWEINKLRKVASIKKGLGYKGKHLTEKGGVCFVSLKSLERGGNFRYNGLKRYNGEYKQDHLVIPGNIIMAVTDMTQNKEIVGRPARIPNLNEDKIIISMDLVKIIPAEDKNKDWVYSLLRYSKFGIEIKEFANGVNVLHLNPELILDKKIIIPKDDIIKKFTKIISRVYKYIDVLELKNQNLRKTRDLLLPGLISGEVDVSKLDIKIQEIEA